VTWTLVPFLLSSSILKSILNLAYYKRIPTYKMIPAAMKFPRNRHMFAMWLVLTNFDEELLHCLDFNWRWFCAFCTELGITDIFAFVNVNITRLEENPQWSNLSLETSQILTTYFGMTRENVVELLQRVLLDLCKHRYQNLQEDEQQSVVIEIWQQGRMAISTTTRFTHECAELLRLKLPEPEIKWHN